MKPGLLISSLLAIAVAIAAAFDLHIMSIAPIYNIPESMMGGVLYVCPAANSAWDGIARALTPFRSQFTIAFFFFFVLIIVGYCWGLYQNLLADKFDKKKYEFVWFLAKSLFWVTLILMILVHTPNSYRGVKLQGVAGDYVLCESNSKDARPVHANAVILSR